MAVTINTKQELCCKLSMQAYVKGLKEPFGSYVCMYVVYEIWHNRKDYGLYPGKNKCTLAYSDSENIIKLIGS